MTKNINEIRYSNPLTANKWNVLNTAFGLMNSLKGWVLEEYTWRRWPIFPKYLVLAVAVTEYLV